MKIEEYIAKLLAHCGLDDSQVEVSVDQKDDITEVQINVPETEVGLLIGHKGENLASIQRMARIAFKDKTEQKIVININNYRQERIQQLEEWAQKIIGRIQETGEEFHFPYLSSYERYIVHKVISEQAPDLISQSEGEGKERRLVVRNKK